MARLFDWSYNPDLKGKLLCSACGPTAYQDGTPTKYGAWHRAFARTYLPIGLFKTNARGNLAHVETGSENYRPFVVREEGSQPNRSLL